MVSRSGPFFDLEGAAAIGRRLSGVTERLLAPHEPRGADLSSGIPPELRWIVETSPTAAEVWDKAMEWARGVLGALGVFVLDEHGFVIAATGDGELAPSFEVFSAAFAEGRRIFSEYLPDAGELREVEFGLGQANRIVLSRREALSGLVLFGVWSVTRPTARRLARTWEGVAGALALHDRLGRMSEEQSQ
jgi:hypothetical protein